MSEVSVRELRNHGGEVIDRVVAGETAIGILDTSVVILGDRIRSRTSRPLQSLSTTLTLAELAARSGAALDEAERAVRRARFEAAQTSFYALPFDVGAARAFGGIAAIAVSSQRPLHTCNPRDFTGIDGLDVVAVPHPGKAGQPAGDR